MGPLDGWLSPSQVRKRQEKSFFYQFRDYGDLFKVALEPPVLNELTTLAQTTTFLDHHKTTLLVYSRISRPFYQNIHLASKMVRERQTRLMFRKLTTAIEVEFSKLGCTQSCSLLRN